MSSSVSKQPAVGQSNLPGMAPRKTARHRPPPYASSWTVAEVQFADALIAHWNTFRENGLPRANQVRRNRFVAIQLYRWIHRGQGADDSDRMTEGDVFVAIEAYSQDSWIRTKCNGQFRSFGDWLRDGADIVDKYLAKAHKKRGHAGPAVHDAKAKKRLAAIDRALDRYGWRDFARHATGGNKPIAEYAEDFAHTLKRWPASDRGGKQKTWLRWIEEDIARFAALPEADRQSLTERAGKALTSHPDRPPAGTLAETNMVFALACATVALFGDRVLRPSNKEGAADG